MAEQTQHAGEDELRIDGFVASCAQSAEFVLVDAGGGGDVNRGVSAWSPQRGCSIRVNGRFGWMGRLQPPLAETLVLCHSLNVGVFQSRDREGAVERRKRLI